MLILPVVFPRTFFPSRPFPSSVARTITAALIGPIAASFNESHQSSWLGTSFLLANIVSCPFPFSAAFAVLPLTLFGTLNRPSLPCTAVSAILSVVELPAVLPSRSSLPALSPVPLRRHSGGSSRHASSPVLVEEE